MEWSPVHTSQDKCTMNSPNGLFLNPCIQYHVLVVLQKLMGSKSRCKKIITNVRRDQISNLPDVILFHILSFLPTKYAVRTSILSKRWKYIWTGVTNLDFYYNHGSESSTIDRFVHFVDRVLSLCNSAYFHKFCISFNCYGPYENGIIDCHRISSWVNEAVRHNVRQLDLNIAVENFELPQSLFTCKTLTFLKICIDDTHVFNMPASISFPSLKIIHVDVYDPPNDLMQKLFRSCPVLEDLTIEGYISEDIELVFDVSSPTLKRLRAQLRTESFEELQYKFVFNAPNLEFLDLQEFFLAKYTVENLSSLVKAIISIGDCCQRDLTSQAYTNRAFKLLKEISGVVHLSLSENTLGVLDFGYHNSLPTFHNLMHLEVTISNCGLKILPNLLESSPNLNELVFKKVQVHRADYDKVAEDFDWSEPESVPNCLSLHLVVIQITGFEGRRRDELKLVEYLLGNAKVLDHLIINSPHLSLEDEVKFCKNLLNFPRGSSRCQIQFIGENFSKF